MSDLVIIGAGISGLSAGFHAQLRKLAYVVYEQNDRVGGLCQTIEKEGFYFDYSGHLLHFKNPHFRTFIEDLLPGNLVRHRRKSFIYSRGVFSRYPFQANLYGLPPQVVKECLLEFVRSYFEFEDLPTSFYPTFYGWIVAKLGKGIGKHFMFPYNEKLWTVSLKRLTCEWLSEYVPRPSLEDIFNGSFAEQKKDFGYNAQFWYPRKGGIQTLADSLASRTPRLVLNERLIRIHLKDKIAEFESGRTEKYEKLISTVSLKTLVKKIKGVVPAPIVHSAERLRHNSILILNLGVKDKRVTDKHWIYLPEKKYVPYRVGVYSNFSRHMAPPDTTSYYVEIAYQKHWRIRREDLVEQAIQNFIEIGFIKHKKDILVSHLMDIDCAYVIYDKHYAESRRSILDFLKKNDIHSIGRYGSWAYSGIEEALEQGKSVIEYLISKRGRSR
jgi:protoporphyrinogen oxidase